METSRRRTRLAAVPLGIAAGTVGVASAVSSAAHLPAHADTAGAVLLALTVAHWLPVRWFSFGDSTQTLSTGAIWLGAAAALVPPPLVVALSSLGHAAGWTLTCQVGNGVHRPRFDVDAGVVNVAIGTVAAAAAAAAAAPLRPPAAAAAAAAIATWVAGSLVVAALEGFVTRQSVARRWLAMQARVLPTAIAMAGVAAACVVAIEQLGPWAPTLVGMAVVVLLSHQAAALHQFHTVTTALLDLATSASSAVTVEDVVELVEQSGSGILGREVRLVDSLQHDAPAPVAVATQPVGDDGWALAVGEGWMGRPFGTGPRERRALDGLAHAADVALTAALARRRISDQATHDDLTGLLNRRGFEETAVRMLRRAGCDGRRVTVAYVDLDGFKPVNDTLGHDAGDEVLAAVGARCREHLRPTDVAGRLGGDEFAVVFGDELTPTAARDRMVGALAELPHGVTASIGVTRGNGDLTALLREADEQMYVAKRGRR